MSDVCLDDKHGGGEYRIEGTLFRGGTLCCREDSGPTGTTYKRLPWSWIISALHKFTRKKNPVLVPTVKNVVAAFTPDTDKSMLTNFANRFAFLILMEEGVWISAPDSDIDKLFSACKIIFSYMDLCRSRASDELFHTRQKEAVDASHALACAMADPALFCLRASSHMKTLSRAMTGRVYETDEETGAELSRIKLLWNSDKIHTIWEMLNDHRACASFLNRIFTGFFQSDPDIRYIRSKPSFARWKKAYFLYDQYKLKTYNGNQNQQLLLGNLLFDVFVDWGTRSSTGVNFNNSMSGMPTSEDWDSVQDCHTGAPGKRGTKEYFARVTATGAPNDLDIFHFQKHNGEPWFSTTKIFLENLYVAEKASVDSSAYAGANAKADTKKRKR